MKRLMSLLLALVMCLTAMTAVAENRELMVSGERDDHFSGLRSLCAVGDTVYMLAYTENGLAMYGWSEGMTETASFAGMTNLVDAGGLVESALLDSDAYTKAVEIYTESGSDPVHAVSQLFTDGQRLMSLNVATGLVFAMDIQDGSAVYTDIVTLKDVKPFLHVSDDWAYALESCGVAVVGGKLLWAVEDWNETGEPSERLVVADLTTGEVKISQVHFVKRICNYTADKALVAIRDDANAYQEDGVVLKPVLAVYDPASDTAADVGEIDVPYYLENMAYAPALDVILYPQSSHIMGMALSDGTVRQYGFYTGSSMSSLPIQVLGSSLVMADWDRVIARSISADFSADTYLNVYGSWADKGRILFSQRFPDIPVYDHAEYYSDLTSLTQAMISGSDALDLLTLDVEYSPYLTMRDKGYCMDLSAYDDLTAQVERMYPCFKDVVMKDGKLLGVPVGASSWGWYANNQAMETLGLTEEDLPKDLVSLCAFVTDFNDNRAEDVEENVTLFDNGGDTKNFLLRQALEMYMGWCTAEGREVTFNTPEFRAVMTAVEGVRCDKLKVTDWESDIYYQPLFEYGYQVVGDFSGYTEDYNTFLPMTLTKDTAYSTGVSVSVLTVNPRSAHVDTAIDLIRCKLEAMEANYAYVLFTDKTEPVENEYYQEWLDSEEQFLTTMREQIEQAADEETRQELQEVLDNETKYVEEYRERNRYSISEAAIARYREQLAPCMYVNMPNFTTSTQNDSTSELNVLIERYADGQITLDQFIREADNKMAMIRMENN